MVRRLVAMIAVVAVLIVSSAGGALALPGKLRNSLLEAHRTDGRSRISVRQDAQPPPPPPRAKPMKLPHSGPGLPMPESAWLGLGMLGLAGGSLLALRRARAGRAGRADLGRTQEGSPP